MSAVWWAVVTACIWGMVPIFEKAALVKISPYAGLFYRCVGVLVGIILLALFVVKPSELKAADGRTIFLLVLSGFMASFLAQLTFYHGLKIGEVSKVVPISASYHLIAFVLGLMLFREAVTMPKIAGVMLIVFGVWLLK